MVLASNRHFVLFNPITDVAKNCYTLSPTALKSLTDVSNSAKKF
jgi:hypothetical protein